MGRRDSRLATKLTPSQLTLRFPAQVAAGATTAASLAAAVDNFGRQPQLYLDRDDTARAPSLMSSIVERPLKGVRVPGGRSVVKKKGEGGKTAKRN